MLGTPEDARARMLLAANYALAGLGPEAQRLLEKALVLRPNDPTTLYNTAFTYAILQMKTEALATLQKSIDAGWSDLDWLGRDTDLRCLHGEPAFQLLIHHKH